MASSRIETLDLRNPWVIMREDARMRRCEPADEIVWDFPEFPAKVSYFIVTGKRMPSVWQIATVFVADVDLGGIVPWLLDIPSQPWFPNMSTRQYMRGLGMEWAYSEKPSRWVRVLAYFGLAPQWR